jgi:hypothetical protein
MYNPNKGNNVSKNPVKIQVQPRQRLQDLSLMELKVPGFGLKRDMTDESGAEARAKLETSGQLVADPSYDGFKTKEQAEAYRAKLIANGTISVGTGLAKLKAARVFRRPNVVGNETQH